jgi:hypothetical protein
MPGCHAAGGCQDPQTEGVLRSLADLKPETLAVMHG